MGTQFGYDWKKTSFTKAEKRHKNAVCRRRKF
jgi:hypothetical protein